MKYYVLRNGIVYHEGDRESCETFIRNSRSLFGVRGQTICVKQGRKYIPA